MSQVIYNFHLSKSISDNLEYNHNSFSLKANGFETSGTPNKLLGVCALVEHLLLWFSFLSVIGLILFLERVGFYNANSIHILIKIFP